MLRQSHTTTWISMHITSVVAFPETVVAPSKMMTPKFYKLNSSRLHALRLRIVSQFIARESRLVHCTPPQPIPQHKAIFY